MGGVFCSRYQWNIEIWSRKSGWSYRLMLSKTYQKSKHCTPACKTHRQDLITLESKCFIFHHNVCESNTAFMWQSNPPGVCACRSVIGQRSTLFDNAELSCSKSWVWLNFLPVASCVFAEPCAMALLLHKCTVCPYSNEWVYIFSCRTDLSCLSEVGKYDLNWVDMLWF